MISMKFDLSRVNAKLDRLTQAANAGVRPAAQAGSQVYYEEVRLRVPVSAKPHKSGKKIYNPGTLRKAVYQAFVEKESGSGRATYRISWNKSHAFYGRFLERGTSRLAARPFLRPAFYAVNRRALRAVNARLKAEVRKALA